MQPVRMASLGRIEETPYLYEQSGAVYNAGNKTFYLNIEH
jgi:hypothetical protein